MARTVQDIAFFADVMFNNQDQGLYHTSTKALIPGKIAASHDMGIVDISDEISNKFQTFIDWLITLPCRMTEFYPDLTGVHDCFDTLVRIVMLSG